VPSPDLNDAQKEFKALMTAAGWKPAEAARQIGMSKATVTYILKGKNTPRLALERLREKANAAAREKLGQAQTEGESTQAAEKLREEIHVLRRLLAESESRLRLLSPPSNADERLAHEVAGSSTPAALEAAGIEPLEQKGSSPKAARLAKRKRGQG
jgi:transcriptional regulator with XRE-family HTH domain